MWEHAGVVRDEASLQVGLDRLAELRGRLGDVDVRPTEEGWGDLAHRLDLGAGIAVAEATLAGALGPARRRAAATTGGTSPTSTRRCG